MRYKYSCGVCGGSVTKPPCKKQDGEGKSLVGLGHWECEKGCPPRKVSVERSISSGHENDKRTEAFQVKRDILVKRILNEPYR